MEVKEITVWLKGSSNDYSVGFKASESLSNNEAYIFILGDDKSVTFRGGVSSSEPVYSTTINRIKFPKENVIVIFD